MAQSVRRAATIVENAPSATTDHRDNRRPRYRRRTQRLADRRAGFGAVVSSMVAMGRAADARPDHHWLPWRRSMIAQYGKALDGTEISASGGLGAARAAGGGRETRTAALNRSTLGWAFSSGPARRGRWSSSGRRRLPSSSTALAKRRSGFPPRAARHAAAAVPALRVSGDHRGHSSFVVGRFRWASQRP